MILIGDWHRCQEPSGDRCTLENGNAFLNGYKLRAQKWEFDMFSQNHKDYLKNHWTNTRLVCTHLNALWHCMQIWQWKFDFWKFLKKVWNFWSVVCTLYICLEMVKWEVQCLGFRAGSLALFNSQHLKQNLQSSYLFFSHIWVLWSSKISRNT